MFFYCCMGAVFLPIVPHTQNLWEKRHMILYFEIIYLYSPLLCIWYNQMQLCETFYDFASTAKYRYSRNKMSKYNFHRRLQCIFFTRCVFNIDLQVSRLFNRELECFREREREKLINVSGNNIVWFTKLWTIPAIIVHFETELMTAYQHYTLIGYDLLVFRWHLGA